MASGRSEAGLQVKISVRPRKLSWLSPYRFSSIIRSRASGRSPAMSCWFRKFVTSAALVLALTSSVASYPQRAAEELVLRQSADGNEISAHRLQGGSALLTQ